MNRTDNHRREARCVRGTAVAFHTRRANFDPQMLCQDVECVGDWVVQPTIGATETNSQGLEQKMFQVKDGLEFRETTNRRLVSAEQRLFSVDFVTIYPPDMLSWLCISLKNQLKTRSNCKPLVNHVCSLNLEHK